MEGGTEKETQTDRHTEKSTRLTLRKRWREGGKKTRETEQERKVEGQSPERGRDGESERQTARQTQTHREKSTRLRLKKRWREGDERD